MRDYAEIAHNLRCCGVGVPCDDCTYQDDIVKCGSLEGQAANAIEELLADVPKWISAEERLPEPYQNVLTCAWKLFGPDRKRVCGIDYVLDNGEWACGGESYKTMVTHWMPLPSTEGLK